MPEAMMPTALTLSKARLNSRCMASTKLRSCWLVTAGAKERAQGAAGIVITALLKSQEDRAAHDNGNMADDAAKIPPRGLPFEVEVFHHFEKHLEIPPFAVDADDCLIRKVPPMQIASKYLPKVARRAGKANQRCIRR